MKKITLILCCFHLTLSLVFSQGRSSGDYSSFADIQRAIDYLKENVLEAGLGYQKQDWAREQIDKFRALSNYTCIPEQIYAIGKIRKEVLESGADYQKDDWMTEVLNIVAQSGKNTCAIVEDIEYLVEKRKKIGGADYQKDDWLKKELKGLYRNFYNEAAITFEVNGNQEVYSFSDIERAIGHLQKNILGAGADYQKRDWGRNQINKFRLLTDYTCIPEQIYAIGKIRKNVLGSGADYQKDDWMTEVLNVIGQSGKNNCAIVEDIEYLVEKRRNVLGADYQKDDWLKQEIIKLYR